MKPRGLWGGKIKITKLKKNTVHGEGSYMHGELLLVIKRILYKQNSILSPGP